MNKSVEFTVQGNTYSIRFPKVGEYLRVKNLKSVLTNGQYGQMSVSIDMDVALDMVDIESIVTILCPQLIKEIEEQHGGFSNLSLEAYKELKKVYDEIIEPWWKDIEKMLRLENK